MKKVLIFLLLLSQNTFVIADDLVITSDYKVINKTEVTSENINYNSDIIDDKYSYNDSEDIDLTSKYLKTNYDFKVKKTKMTVGLKGFSFHFPF